MNFSTSIATCFSKFAIVKGRAKRSEFWWFFVFWVLADLLFAVVDSILVQNNYPYFRYGLLRIAFNLMMLFPFINVFTRRLHDTNRTGWWQLLWFSVIGIPILIYWASKKGDEGQNSYD